MRAAGRVAAAREHVQAERAITPAVAASVAARPPGVPGVSSLVRGSARLPKKKVLNDDGNLMFDHAPSGRPAWETSARTRANSLFDALLLLLTTPQPWEPSEPFLVSRRAQK